MVGVIEPLGDQIFMQTSAKTFRTFTKTVLDSREKCIPGGQIMANRRFEMGQYRQVIHRMCMGQTDRAIAKTKLMGRFKCSQVRAIAERYERKSNIVTSNLDIPEWTDAFPNRILGAATIDRLRHGAYKVVPEGKSYRSPRAASKLQPKNCQRTDKKSPLKGGEKH